MKGCERRGGRRVQAEREERCVQGRGEGGEGEGVVQGIGESEGGIEGKGRVVEDVNGVKLRCLR